MKHPVWIINSTLFLLLIAALIIIFFSRVSIPEREDIEPTQFSKLKKEKKLQINIAQIYEADLFGTYATAQAEPEETEEVLFPPPPEPQEAEIPELPKPQFLAPLDITLRGIFMVNIDSTHNRTIIADNKTKKEASYKIGDKILDAQLIRIFANKIILLRSNGQQEVLYLREQDALLDAGYAMIDEWNTIAKMISSYVFMVDPFAFAKRVPDLGQLIEMLHLITAYKNGQSIGVRIGSFDEKSVGTVLGLQPGHIITHIENIPATDLEQRLKIYQRILNKRENETVTVQLVRNQQPLTFEYILKELMPEEGQRETPKQQYILQKIEEDEKIKILKQKHEFAPTLQEIRQRERQNMMNKGQMPQS
jgi:type II secretory pathway component PulC